MTANYFALNHRGYIYAALTGAYTFSFFGVDDAVWLWVGPTAYSGWTRANADLTVTFQFENPYRPASGSRLIQLTHGQYYPLRIMFAQTYGEAVFQFTVTAPDGTEFLSSDSAGSDYLVQYSCDGTTAPQFPPFGSEV